MAEPAALRHRALHGLAWPRQGLHLVAVALVVLYLWPYWLLGQDAHVLVHDQLDSVFISLKILAESGLMFAHPDTPVPAMGIDVPRAAYPSPLFGVVLLFKLFGAFGGYVASQLIIRLVAYWGMYRLLTRHFLPGDEQRLPAALAALAFACLPHYALFGLSITGQPLFFSSLLAIRAGRGKTLDWIILALFPMGSLPALGGMFAILAGGLLWLADLVARRPGAWRLFWALVLAGAMTLVVEYQIVMIILKLARGFVSHRTEIELGQPGLAAAWGRAWHNFQRGQYHAPSLQAAVILPAAAIALAGAAWGRDGVLRGPAGIWPRTSGAGWAAGAVLLALAVWAALLWRGSRLAPGVLAGAMLTLALLLAVIAARVARMRPSSALSGPLRLLAWSLFAALLISFWYGLWPLLWAGIASVAPQLPYVNLSRFHYLHPMLWSMVLAALLAILWRQGRGAGKVAVALVVAVHGWTLVQHAEHRQSRLAGDPTFRQFFSPALFSGIHHALAAQTAAPVVVSVGLHPAVAAYNGLHTLDGYLANYPLAYKQAFRRLIAGELARDAKYRRYFDEWGSRFYIFSHELAAAGNAAFELTRQRVDGLRLDDLRFDTQAFKAMGGTHVISALPIGNARALGLELLTVAENPASPWRLFVYSASGTKPHADSTETP